MLRLALLVLSLLFTACGDTAPPSLEADAGCATACGTQCCAPGQICSGSTCADPCVPQCEGRKCGPDGCGGSCGACGAHDSCDEASGTCLACQPSCDGRQCGSDGCGGTCGSCPAGDVCNAAGICEVCAPRSCAQLGLNCGQVADGCGDMLDCGTCTAPETCGAAGQPNVCGCSPATCASLGKTCGVVPDGCGGTLQCGSCQAGKWCNEGVCADGPCIAETDKQFCESRAASCGTVVGFDRCEVSRSVNCGVCGATETCGLERENVCGNDCRKGAVCAGLTWCDAATGICRPGCVSDGQCGGNERCDVASHTCLCKTGFHACNGSCVPDTSVSSCGGRCTPCPAPANATPTCTGGACGFTCNTGFHECNGQCVRSDSAATCGSRCTPCPAPANGSATCNAGVCGVACDPGHHLCDGQCAPDDSVATCGSRCSPCFNPSFGSAICENGSCGVACNSGYHACGGDCVSNNTVDTCGSRCTPCPVPENGAAICTGGACGFICNAGYHACGDQCLSDTSIGSCGGRCTPCPAPADATSTCNGGSCGFTCDPGFHRCGDQCAPDSSVSQCGSACVACAPPANSTPACVAGQCEFACNEGFIECNGACVACADPNGTASCSPSGTCEITCDSGHHECNGECVDSSSPAHCGASCTPCPDNDPHGSASCSALQCGIACVDGYRFCGSACAACPSASGVASFKCSGASCAVDACDVGYYPCATGCCLWRTEVVAQVNTTQSRSFAAVLDGQGTPHVAFVDASFKVAYAVRTGSNVWSVQTIADATPSAAPVSIALDSLERPAISYGSAYQVNLARWNGVAWQSEPVFSSSEGEGPQTSRQALVFDGADVPHMLQYQTASAGSGYQSTVRHHWRTPTGWTSSIVATEAGRVSAPTLAIAPDQTLYGTWSAFEQARLRIVTRTAGSWSLESLAPNELCCGDAWITVGPTGTPIIGTRGEGGRYIMPTFSELSQRWAGWGTFRPCATAFNVKVNPNRTLTWLYTTQSGSSSLLNLAVSNTSGITDHHLLAYATSGYVMNDANGAPHVVYGTDSELVYLWR